MSHPPTGRPLFNDPAVMSARFVPASSAVVYGELLHHPPGLSYPQGPSSVVRLEDSDNTRMAMNNDGSAYGELISSLSQGREVSVPSPVLLQCGKSVIGVDVSSALFPAILIPLLGMDFFSISNPQNTKYER